MPWREVSVSGQREEFVRLARMPGANVSELCRRFGVARSNGYKWLARYAAVGEKGLAELSRRPKASPLRTPAAVEAQVLRIREASNGAWGGRKIAKVLQREGLPAPSASTITEVLRRHGRLEARAGEHPGPWRRFERDHPNELWQMDFKGHFELARGRCHPLTVLDDHSRYSLGLEACGDEQDLTVRGRLSDIFRRYGLPLAMLADNGSPWGSAGADAWTALEIWLMRLGVTMAHGGPRHPQTQGKDERFHRTLKAEVLQGRTFGDLAQCQSAFDAWRARYNHERPHEALEMQTPSARYRPSPRAFPPRLPPIEYGPGDQVRKVCDKGCVSFKNRQWRVGKAFRGLHVALRETPQDGRYTVRFCAQQIGQIDLTAETSNMACGLVDEAIASPTIPQAPAP
jgi:transposase InsO family protein